MLELVILAAPCLTGFYLIFSYAFFFFPYLFYMFGKHPGHEKVLRTFSFVLTPMLIPLAVVLWIGWKTASIFAGILVVFLFAWVAWLAWLNSRFPFGTLLKAWFNFANGLLQKVQELLELVGVKKLLFGISVHSFQPLA